MSKALFPKTSVKGGNSLTIAGLPGVSVKIVDVFAGEKGEEYTYGIDAQGSIGRVKAPDYILTDNTNKGRFKQMMQELVKDQKGAVNSVKNDDLDSIGEYDGVGIKTVTALMQANLTSAIAVVDAGRNGLLKAGVHISVVQALLDQATESIGKDNLKQIENRESTLKFLEGVATRHYYSLEMRVLVEDPSQLHNVIFFNMDGARKVTASKLHTTASVPVNTAEGAEERSCTPQFRKKVRVKISNSEEARRENEERILAGKKPHHTFHTERLENCIKYATLSPNGRIKVVNISLVSQDGEFFLTAQEVYKEAAFKLKGNPIIPGMEESVPHFCNHFREKFNWNGVSLKHINAYREDTFDYSTLKPKEGRVSFFSVAMGTGEVIVFDRTNQKPMALKLHWKSCTDGNGLVRFDKGDIVRVGSIREFNPANEKRTSRYTHEAQDVSYVSSPEPFRHPASKPQANRAEKPRHTAKS